MIVNCTAYGCVNGVRTRANTASEPVLAVNCHVTDNSGYGFKNGYLATANHPLIRYHCRTRDNTSGADDGGFANWANINPVTTDTGGAATDYADAASGDFRLINSAPGDGSGVWADDIGALEAQDPAGGGGGLLIGNKQGNKQ